MRRCRYEANSEQYWDVATDALDLDNHLLCETAQNSNDLLPSRCVERLCGGHSEVQHVQEVSCGVPLAASFNSMSVEANLGFMSDGTRNF